MAWRQRLFGRGAVWASLGRCCKQIVSTRDHRCHYHRCARSHLVLGYLAMYTQPWEGARPLSSGRAHHLLVATNFAAAAAAAPAAATVVAGPLPGPPPFDKTGFF
eukprot:COSAG06_NODE_310_length_17775_cov_9.971374_16_plen_105_part_00